VEYKVGLPHCNRFEDSKLLLAAEATAILDQFVIFEWQLPKSPILGRYHPKNHLRLPDFFFLKIE